MRRSEHKALLRSLTVLQKQRDLTPREWWEMAEHHRALGDVRRAEAADLAARQSARHCAWTPTPARPEPNGDAHDGS